jgi:hypothetical protein
MMELCPVELAEVCATIRHISQSELSFGKADPELRDFHRSVR